MNIRLAETNDEPMLAGLVQGFRDALAVLRSSSPADLEAARAELADYVEKRFPIYVAEDASGALAGYLVCRVDGDVVFLGTTGDRPADAHQVGIGARRALQCAIVRAVRSANAEGAPPGESAAWEIR